MRRNALSKGAELGPLLAVLQLQGTESCQTPNDLGGGSSTLETPGRQAACVHFNVVFVRLKHEPSCTTTGF